MNDINYDMLAQEAFSILCNSGSLHRRQFVELIKKNVGENRSYELKLLKTDEMGSDQISVKLLRKFATLRGDRFKYNSKTHCWIEKN